MQNKLTLICRGVVYLENKSKKINGVFGTAFGYEEGSAHAVSNQYQSVGVSPRDTCTGLDHGMLEANKSVQDIVEKVGILLKKLNTV